MNPVKNLRDKIWFRILRNTVGALATLGIFAVLVRQLSVGDLRNLLNHPLRLVAYLLLLPLIPVFKILCWHQITRSLGIAHDLSGSFRACFLSIAGRYIPGKVFFVMGRIAGYGPERSRLALATYGMVIEFAVEVLAGMILCIVALAWAATDYPFRTPLMVAASALALLLIQPRLIRFGARKIFQWTGRGGELPETRLGYTELFSFLLLTLLHWAAYLLALWTVLSVVIEIHLSDLPILGAAISVSATSATLAVFAPGGLGVREGLTMEILNQLPAMNRGVSLLIASLARLTQWMGELLALGLFFLYLFFTRSRRQSEN